MPLTRAPATLMLVPDLPVADEWQRAASRCQDVVAVRVRPGPRTSGLPRPGSDGVITITRPRLRARRYRRHGAHRLDADVLTELVDQLTDEGRVINLVHGHFAAGCGGLPGLRARRDIPYVVSEHSSALTFDNPHKQISSGGLRTARAVYAAADRVLPVSRTLGEAIVRRDLAQHAQLAVVPNPVDTGRFRPADRPSTNRRVVTVARLVAVKRLELMIDAIAVLDERGLTATLDIIGDGPEREALVRRAARRGVGELVGFTGRLGRDDVAAALRTAHVFALSSFTENLPVAALEAMASGLPIVAPAVGGLVELVEDAPGETYRPGDVIELANALDRWLRADENTVTHARRTAEARYGIDAVGDRLASIYDDAIGRRAHPNPTRSSKG